MRQGSIKLGRILGVPVAMDPGVVLVGGLLSWLLATVILPGGAPGLVGSVYWSLGIVGALLFLGSLLAHEMAHSVVARRNGVEVEGVTLWLFGGFAQFASEPRDAGAEFRISASGPATSVAVGALFVGAALGLRELGVPAVYTTMLGWLGLINGFLGVFNLLPGAPLDGGRILAAVLWKVRGDRLAGRIGAARAGKGVGLLIAGAGVFEMMAVRGFSGLWTVFIGWFIFNAARTEQVFFTSERALGDLRVGEAMTADPHFARTWTTVAELVDGPLRWSRRSAIPVLDWNGSPVGFVTMEDVSRVPAEHWQHTAVARLTHDAPDVPTASPEDRVVDLLERLGPGSGGHALVVEDGRTVGVIGPEEIRHAIEIGRMRRTAPRVTPPPPPASVPHQQHWEPPLQAR